MQGAGLVPARTGSASLHVSRATTRPGGRVRVAPTRCTNPCRASLQLGPIADLYPDLPRPCQPAPVAGELQARNELLEDFVAGHAEFLEHVLAERGHGDRHREDVLLEVLGRDDDDFVDPVVVDAFLGGSGNRQYDGAKESRLAA